MRIVLFSFLIKKKFRPAQGCRNLTIRKVYGIIILKITSTILITRQEYFKHPSAFLYYSKIVYEFIYEEPENSIPDQI